MEILLLLLGITAILTHGLSLAVYAANRVFLRGPGRGAPLPDGDAPRVSILIPARNEAPAIGATLRAALGQDYPDFEIVLVDDRSTDGTRAAADAAAAESPSPERLRILEGSEPEAGWLGKPWALKRAAEAASGEYLLFIDADIRLDPGTLTATVREMRGASLDALSLLPEFRRHGFWNEVLEPMLTYMTLFGVLIPWLNWDGQKRVSIASGAFLCVRRDAYDGIGGHAAVRNLIIDDVGLALRLKRSGARCRVLDGRRLVSLRMYQGLGDFIPGYRKNLAATQSSPWVLGAGLLFYFLLGVAQPLWGAGLAISALGSGGELTRGGALMAAGALLLLASRLLLCLEIRQNPLYALSHPLFGLIFCWIFCLSCWDRFVRREILWRGRKIHPADTEIIPPL